MTRHPRRRSRLLATALSALLVSAAGLALAPSAQAAPDPGWGPGGTLPPTDSAVTVSWDGAPVNGHAAPAADRLTRDAGQALPYTDGKTYDDVDQRVRNLYGSMYGPANGLGGMKVTVSQTSNLLDQAVGVSISGIGGASADVSKTTRFSVLECWGAPGANGAPDPQATSPDPTTCQYGPGGPDSAISPPGISTSLDLPLMSDAGKSVLTSFNDGTSFSFPFRPIDGSGLTSALKNPFFSAVTSNELTQVVAQPDGTAQFTYETQTGAEAPGLGCGFRTDAPSTPSCWLVVVPRNTTAWTGAGLPDQVELTSPLTPSLWAQRVQVKLGFGNVTAGCPTGRARTLTQGSELVAGAMTSWIPGACGAVDLSLGYTNITDREARNNVAAGSGVGFVTQPATADGVTHVPVALDGVAIGYSVDDHARDQIRDLKLDARLVAKLLTESYVNATDNVSGAQTTEKAPWMNAEETSKPPTRYPYLWEDPEFQKLNPDVVIDTALADPVVTLAETDATDAVWGWLLGDPDARSFLDGCPDPWGSVINPFFSTRTYAECPDQARALEAEAAGHRAPISAANPLGTELPSNTAAAPDTPMSYPPDGVAFPQPDWYERDARPQQIALSLADLQPRVNSLAEAGRDGYRAFEPQNAGWCDGIANPLCRVPGLPGKWTSSAVPEATGTRAVAVITDTATAAKYQLPTALLCDDSGKNCVGATTASLQKAASQFVASDAGAPQPPATPDYKGGAYPLAMPIYAAVPAGLSDDDRAAAVTALRYITTTGQQPGFAPGDLPAGYAPLTATMKKAADAALTKLASTGETVVDQQQPSVDFPSTVFPPTRVPPPAASVPDAPPTVSKPAVNDLATQRTAAVQSGFPQFGLIGGLVVALIAGLLAPVLSRKRRSGS